MKDNLGHRGIHTYIQCHRCNTSMKTTNHCFMSCWRDKNVWFSSQLNINFNNKQTNFTDWCKHNFRSMSKYNLAIFINILDGIWSARNKDIFEQKDSHIMKVIISITHHILQNKFIPSNKCSHPSSLRV